MIDEDSIFWTPSVEEIYERMRESGSVVIFKLGRIFEHCFLKFHSLFLDNSTTLEFILVQDSFSTNIIVKKFLII